MAKKRYINTKFWSDDFIIDLNPLERYLFLYILTNEHTDICGIYELPLKVIQRETDLTQKQVIDILRVLKSKIDYVDGWICIKNFEKHQAVNPKVIEGMKRSREQVPKEILAKLSDNNIDYDRLSKPTIGSELLTPTLTPTLKLNIYTSKMDETDFETFWVSYPNKQGKKPTKNKFLKLEKKLLPKILSSIEAQKKSTQWKQGYIPNPLTWINQERWEDELAENERPKEISERRRL